MAILCLKNLKYNWNKFVHKNCPQPVASEVDWTTTSRISHMTRNSGTCKPTFLEDCKI